MSDQIRPGSDRKTTLVFVAVSGSAVAEELCAGLVQAGYEATWHRDRARLCDAAASSPDAAVVLACSFDDTAGSDVMHDLRACGHRGPVVALMQPRQEAEAVRMLRQAAVGLASSGDDSVASVVEALESVDESSIVGERTRAEEELAATTRLLEGILNAIPDIIGLQDSEHRIIRYNAAGYRFLGLTPDEVVGRTCHSLVGRDLPCVPCATSEAFESKAPARIERFEPAVDMWLDVRAYPILDDDGNVVQVIEHLRDITARKRAEQELQHQYDLTARIMETSPVGIVVAGPDGEISFANSAAEQILGLSRASGSENVYEAPEWRLTDYDGVRLPREKLSFNIVMRTGKPVDGLRHAVQWPDGRRVLLHINASPLVDAESEVTAMVAALHDVTDIVRATDALRESEARFRSIVESSPMGMHMYRLHEDDRLVFAGANPAADEILGLDNQQFVGMTVEQAFPPLAATEIPDRYRETARTGTTWHGEQVEYRDERIAGAFEVHAFQTAPGAMAAMFSDVSERKRAEEEIRRLNRELEERVRMRTAQLEAVNRELEAFVYSVSHDLRAPLRSMDGFSRILLEDHGDTLGEEAIDALQRISVASQRMGSLIQDLLELSRLARLEITRGPVSLSRMAEAAVAELREAKPSRQVRVTVQPDVEAVCDANLVRIVLANLLGNAWKFTSRTDDACIEFGCHAAEEREWVFFVRDNGAGFDPAYADKIFAPFQRLHSATEYEGSGVGLATVQRIIVRHGGRIWADGEVGKGATFSFTLG